MGPHSACAPVQASDILTGVGRVTVVQSLAQGEGESIITEQGLYVQTQAWGGSEWDQPSGD